MAYFEKLKLNNTNNNTINPAEEDSLTLLRAIFRLLKPLGFITGAGSNRLSVDVSTVSSVSSVSAVTTVSTVSSVSTVTNIPTISNISSFELMKAMSRTGYNTGIRANLS